MKYIKLALLCCFLLAAAPAQAAFIIRAGDTVYIDGRPYTWEEWKKLRDNPGSQPSAAAPRASEPAPAGAPLAASCTTAIYYDEFPSEDERFECSAGLGALTREQILEKGWKVDLVEKLPPPAGQPAQSPRGLPLYLYKLVISRPLRDAVPPARAPYVPPATRKLTDSSCMDDCLANGALKEFCAERCTY